MYGWAPLAIMGEEINKLAKSTIHAPYNNNTRPRRRSRSEEDTAVEMSLMSDDPLSSSSTTTHDPSSSSPSSYKSPHEETLNDTAAADDDDGMAGIYLGIHNIFATIPQFLATFISMIVFSILEPGQSPELTAAGAGAAASEPGRTSGGNGKMDDDASGQLVAAGGLSGTAVCLAIGAVFQLVAAAQSLRMRRF